MDRSSLRIPRPFKPSPVLLLTGLCALGMAGCRCGTVTVSDAFQPAPSPSHSEDREFTLAVWNIRKTKDPASLDDVETLSKVKEADLILTQESASDLPDPDGIGSVFACSWRYPWPGGRYVGVRTYSRVRPIEARSFPSKFREFWVTTPKVTLASEHLIDAGRSLLAINIHGLNFERFGIRQLGAQLEDLRPEIESHDGPVILAGDFNTWNPKRAGLLERFTRELGLEEVTSFPEGRKTGDLGSRFINRLFGIVPDLPLDRVFVRDLKAREAEVLDYQSSDHPPLLVRLGLE